MLSYDQLLVILLEQDLEQMSLIGLFPPQLTCDSESVLCGS